MHFHGTAHLGSPSRCRGSEEGFPVVSESFIADVPWPRGKGKEFAKMGASRMAQDQHALDGAQHAALLLTSRADTPNLIDDASRYPTRKENVSTMGLNLVKSAPGCCVSSPELTKYSSSKHTSPQFLPQLVIWIFKRKSGICSLYTAIKACSSTLCLHCGYALFMDWISVMALHLVTHKKCPAPTIPQTLSYHLS